MERNYQKFENIQVKNRKIITGKKYFELITDEVPKNNLVTNKLYNRRFILNNDLFFEEGIIFEDILYNIFSVIRAKKIKYFNFYSCTFRLNRKGSTTTNLNIEKAKNSCKKIIEIYFENYEELRGIKVIENKMIDLYFNYLDFGGKREKNIEDRFFRLNKKEFIKVLKYKIKLFKRTYIEKRYKF